MSRPAFSFRHSFARAPETEAEKVNRLVNQHAGIAKAQASVFFKKTSFEGRPQMWGQLYSEALWGLFEAARKYNHESPASFKTFAKIIISFRLKDFLYAEAGAGVKNGQLIKQHLRISKKIGSFRNRFFLKTGRHACLSDIANHLDCDIDTADKLRVKSQKLSLISHDDILEFAPTPNFKEEYFKKASTKPKEFTKKTRIEKGRRVLLARGLSKYQVNLLKSYYMDGLTLKCLAKKLGSPLNGPAVPVTESRMSQLLRQAREKARQKMAGKSAA